VKPETHILQKPVVETKSQVLEKPEESNSHSKLEEEQKVEVNQEQAPVANQAKPETKPEETQENVSADMDESNTEVLN